MIHMACQALLCYLKQQHNMEMLSAVNSRWRFQLSSSMFILLHINPLPHRLLQTEQIQIRISVYSAYGIMIRYHHTLVDLTSNFFVLCTNVKGYEYNYS